MMTAFATQFFSLSAKLGVDIIILAISPQMAKICHTFLLSVCRIDWQNWLKNWFVAATHFLYSMVRSTISSTQWSEAPFLLLNGQKHHFFYSMVRSTISSTQWSKAPFLLLNGQKHHFFLSMVQSTISSTQWSKAPFLLLNGQKHHFFYSMVKSTISSIQWPKAPFLLLNGPC